MITHLTVDIFSSCEKSYHLHFTFQENGDILPITQTQRFPLHSGYIPTVQSVAREAVTLSAEDATQLCVLAGTAYIPWVS